MWPKNKRNLEPDEVTVVVRFGGVGGLVLTGEVVTSEWLSRQKSALDVVIEYLPDPDAQVR